MQIKYNMDLNQLAERMGNVATEEDAEAMRELLVEKYDGSDVEDVPEVEWLALLDAAVAK